MNNPFANGGSEVSAARRAVDELNSLIGGIDPSNQAPPRPVDAENHWPEPPAEEAYHGLAGEFLRIVGPHTEADPAAVLAQFLCFFGNAIGRNAFFPVGADQHHGNINAIIVGATASGRKGTSLSQVRRLFEFVDPGWTRTQILSGLSSGEGLIWAVRDPIERKEAQKEKGHVTGYESVIVDHGIADKRLLVIESEFSSTLKVAAREGNTLTGVVRQAWDTGDLRLMTKTNPAQATGAHISVVGHIPQDELLRCISSTELGNGFANRFLWVCAKRSKLLPDGGRLPTTDLAPVLDRLRAAVAYGKAAGEIQRDAEARAQWHAVYGHLSAGKPGLLGAILNRAEAQVLRISLLYALLDQSSTIRAEHLRAALALWEFCENSVRHIFGDMLGDPIADAILSALRATPNGITRTDISALFSRNQDKQSIDAALRLLLKQQLAMGAMEQTSGRPIERWRPVTLSNEARAI